MISAAAIRTEALRIGFHACGVARAEAVTHTHAEAFRQWLNEGEQAGMDYMRNYEEIRLNPCKLMEGAKSIVCLALNYFPKRLMPKKEYQIARYAYGKDYHDVMKAKLFGLLEAIRRQAPHVQGKVCCDTAPLLEKYWAWRAGLGWIGKHSQLIIPHAGSYFFLGELILNEEADCYDTPLPNRCGTCRQCLEACPTHALKAPYSLSAGRCLSYLTIEHRGEFPPDTGLKMKQTIYGCDECLKACPYNRFAKPTDVEEFRPSPALLEMKRSDWQQLTPEQYRTLFKGSAVKRAKYDGLMRNIRAVAEAEQTR